MLSDQLLPDELLCPAALLRPHDLLRSGPDLRLCPLRLLLRPRTHVLQLTMPVDTPPPGLVPVER